MEIKTPGAPINLEEAKAEIITVEDLIIKEEARSPQEFYVIGVAKKITMKRTVPSSRNMTSEKIIEEILLIMRNLLHKTKINQVIRLVILLEWQVPQKH